MGSSIVKVAIFENDILPHFKNYSNKFFQVPLGRNSIRKYGVVKNDMVIMISQNNTMTNNGGVIYNVMITVMMNDKTKEIPEEDLRILEEAMPFKFLPAPKILEDTLRTLDLI